MSAEPPRAVLFVDGNNWYHGLVQRGVTSPGSLDYALLSRKLVGTARLWVATRYYIGALKGHHRDFQQQRRFLSALRNDDTRITIHYGRIEDQPKPNRLSAELLALLERTTGLDALLRRQLTELAHQHKFTSLMKEKAADVLLAVDMCRLAQEDVFDAAYLLSADGDFTPAVEFVQSLGKKVYAASPADCAALRNCAHRYLPLQATWFADCYRTPAP